MPPPLMDGLCVGTCSISPLPTLHSGSLPVQGISTAGGGVWACLWLWHTQSNPDVYQGEGRKRERQAKQALERVGGKQGLQRLGMRQDRSKEYRGTRKRGSSQECSGWGGGRLKVIKAENPVSFKAASKTSPKIPVRYLLTTK